MHEWLCWKKEWTNECMRMDGVVFLKDCMFWLCNDGTTSLRGRFSLVVAVEGQLRLRMSIELYVL